MRWRRAILPLAWTVAACVLLTAGWVVYTVTDPFAGQRQRAVQEHLFQQWRTAPHHAGQASTGAATGRGAATQIEVGPDRARRPGGGGPGTGRDQPGPADAAQHRPRPDPPGDRPAVRPDPDTCLRAALAVRHRRGHRPQPAGARPGSCAGHRPPRAAGNFVVAAHDVTAGNPFLHLRTLRNPDKIYVYTRSRV